MMKALKNIAVYKSLQTFLAATITFTVIVLGGAFFFLSEMNRQIIFTEQELRGVDYHSSLLSFLKETEEYRGEKYISKHGDILFDALLTDKYNEIKTALAAVSALNNNIGKNLGVFEKWNDLVQRLESLRKQEKSLTPDEFFDVYTVFNEDVINLMSYVGDTSNLITDPELDSYYLMSLMVNIIPGFTEEVARLRGKTAAYIADGANSKNDENEILTLHGRLDEVHEKLARTETIVQRHNPSIAQEMDATFRRAELVYQEFDDKFNGYVANGFKGITAWEFFSVGTKVVDENIKFYGHTAKNLRILLSDRIQKKMWIKYIIYSISLIILLAIIVFYVFCHRMLMQRVNAERFLLDANVGLESMVSERTQALQLRNEELEDAKLRADEANKVKGDFLATMSHEIRTPMNGIIGMTELLLETKMSQKQKSFAQTVLGSADALLTIINDILDFSKIESGKLELEPIPFDLSQVVEDVAALLSVRARENGVEMIVRYVPETPQYLIGDPGRIRQVIANLVSNAIKFTEKGYVMVMIEEEQSAVSGERCKLKISVKDTGIGIAEDKQKAVFEKFTQADTSTTRQFGGTGLGLAICRELSGIMGGEVGVESQFGAGSTFWFTMALEKNPDVRDCSVLRKIDNLQGLRVLIVDDIPVNCELLEERLKALGMKPTVCYDGVEALRALQTATEPFHMAVIDYLMPGINGEDLAKEIKKNESFKNPALVMLTATAENGEADRFAKAGFSAFLTKPVRASELAETLSIVWGKYKDGNTQSMIASDYVSGNKMPQGIEAVQFKDTLILLAEDNKTNQGFAVEILTSANCKVDIANDGKEAIAKVRNKPYDLIFMDCEMPEMNGFEATRMMTEMQTDKLLGKIPIIALTASAMKGDRDRCIEAGMVDYISKPMRKIEMLEMLYKYLPQKVDESATKMVQVRFDGYSVLLVEDNRTNRMLAEEMLDEIGFEISIAVNGREAVDAMRQGGFDLILMDVQMPVMDGLEATQKIRLMMDENIIAETPIIALTANAMKGDREECTEAGMNDYLSKPVRKADLNAVIAKWLKPRVAESLSDDEYPVLDEDLLRNYREIMGRKFVLQVEGFLEDTQTLINNISKAWDREDLKTIRISAHSLKSSSAMLGAMELSHIAEILEVDTHEVMANNAVFKGINPATPSEMHRALERAVPYFERYLEVERQHGEEAA